MSGLTLRRPLVSRTPRTTTTVAIAILCVLAVRCSPADEPVRAAHDKIDASEPVSGMDRSETILAWVETSIGGPAPVSWRGVTVLQLNRVETPDGTINYLNVGMPGPEISGDRITRFRWGFDFLSYDDQAGSYVLQHRRPDASKPGDGALVVLVKAKPEAKNKDELHDWSDVANYEEFPRLGEDCTLTLTEGALDGTIHCPALTGETDATVSLHACWTRVEAATPPPDTSCGVVPPEAVT